MKEFRVYKPNSSNTGSAMKLQFRIKPKEGKKFVEPMLFMEIAQQTGTDANNNAQFDWANTDGYKGNSVTMKLGIPDVSELLLVLYKEKDSVGKEGKGLYHQNRNGNTILKFAAMRNGHAAGYMAQLSTAKEFSFRISLTRGEAIILRVLLHKFIESYYEWENH